MIAKKQSGGTKAAGKPATVKAKAPASNLPSRMKNSISKVSHEKCPSTDT